MPIEKTELRTGGRLVYNFLVSELHCYAVGFTQVLVHNTSGGNAPLGSIADQINSLIRQLAGFNEKGIPLIIDNNCSRRGMAQSLRDRGFNVRTVREIFGTDRGDPAIIALAQRIGARVLTINIRDFGRIIGIPLDIRATLPETWIQIIINALK